MIPSPEFSILHAPASIFVKPLDNTRQSRPSFFCLVLDRGSIVGTNSGRLCLFLVYSKKKQKRVRLFACLLYMCGSLGCVFGNLTPPPLTSVAATSHPLVAQYSITQTHSGLSAWVEFGTDVNYGRQTSVITSTATGHFGETLNILVAGMKPQTTYHMRAHAEWPGGSWVDQDQTFTTGTVALPTTDTPGSASQLPAMNVTTQVPGVAPAPGVELLSLVAPPAVNSLPAIVTDLQGNIIWYYPFGGFPIKPMSNGHFIVNRNDSLREVDLAGDTIRDVSVAQANQSLQANGYTCSIISFHHDVLTLPNGHWITLGQISKPFTDLPGYPGITNVLGDVIVDTDPNGNVVWVWSSFDHLDVNRHLQGLPDWTHSNALVYTPSGDLLLSMRNQSWILKIGYSNGTGTGNVLWKLGNGGDFTLTGGDPSQWFYGQHNPDIVSTNGSVMTLAVFDDGNLRIGADGVACGSTASAPACYTRATIFQVDQATNVASVAWQYLPGFYTFWGGSIGLLSNGDVELTSSEPFNTTTSPIIEVTNTDAPQIVWQMNITGEFAYRGSRIPSLYPSVTWTQ